MSPADWHGSSDYVEITDGDGTLLGHLGGEFYMDEGDSGSGSGEGSGNEIEELLRPEGSRGRISDITSVTETVHVLFHTSSYVLNGVSRVSL